MSRLILVPQYPTRLRYQEWWYREFPKHFTQYFDKVIILGNDYGPIITITNDLFAPTSAAIQFEIQQVRQYTQMQLREDDTLLLCDISYPGLFANVLFHKRPKKCFAICHATSKNSYDIFQKDRGIKFPIETATAKLFDSIFVATKYHRNKLWKWPNVIVQAFPMPPFEPGQVATGRNRAIVSVSRDTIQKRTKRIEHTIEKAFKCTISTPKANSWKKYYEFLADSMIMLITSKEETYGYQVVDAITNGCIPIAPNHFSYPELLPPEYLYSSINELIFTMVKALKFELPVPQLLTRTSAELFYQNLSTYMQA